MEWNITEVKSCNTFLPDKLKMALRLIGKVEGKHADQVAEELITEALQAKYPSALPLVEEYLKLKDANWQAACKALEK